MSDYATPARPHRHEWPDGSIARMSLFARNRWFALTPSGNKVTAADGKETHPTFEAAAQALAALGFGPKGRKGETR